MAGVNMKIAIVDGFSSVMNKFESIIDKASRNVIKMENSVTKAGGVLNTAARQSFSLSDGLQKLYFGFGAIEKIAPLVKNAISGASAEMKSLAEFGEQGGKAFNAFVTTAANRLGRAASDLNEAGRAWHKNGAGGEDIERLTQIADKFAKFGDNNSFKDVANVLNDAIRTKNVGAMAGILGGSSRVEQKLKRAGMERALRRGDIKGAMDIYERIADSLGMTSEKAERFGDTLENKIKKTVNILRNWFAQLLSTVANKLSPIMDDIASVFTSGSMQSALHRLLSAASSVADRFMFLYRAVKDFVTANRDIIEMTITIGGMTAAVYGCVKAVTALNIALRANPAVAVITGAIVGFTILKRKVEEWTGSTISAVDFIIGSLVGGVVQVVSAIADAGIGIWNGIKWLAEKISNIAIGLFESLVNGFRFVWYCVKNGAIQIFNWIKTKISSFVSGIVDSIRGIAERLADATRGTVFEIEGLDEAVKKLDAFKSSLSDVKGVQADAEPFEVNRFGRVRLDSTGYIGADWSAKAIGAAINLKNKAFKGLGGAFESAKTDNALSSLSGIERNTGKILGEMTKKEDLRWLKELAEREFINNVNVRTLSPTVNIQTHNANMKPHDVARELTRALETMQASSAYGAHGGY